MKRAGDVIGVPQWQDDPLAQWEALNTLTPDQERMKDAADSMQEAINRLGECISWMDSAAFYVDGMPAADKIISMMNSMDELQSEIEKLQKKLAEGGEGDEIKILLLSYDCQEDWQESHTGRQIPPVAEAERKA